MEHAVPARAARHQRPPLPSRLAQVLLALAGSAVLVSASPYPKDDLHDAGYSYLMVRDCASYCGADNQLCCSEGQVCTTVSNNIATCVAGGGGGGGGGGGARTTTWTETHTYTSTIMTNWAPAPAPTPGVDCKPQSSEQEACGPICCAGWQTCAYKGQCMPRPGYQEPSAVVVTTNGAVTTQYSAPYRVTGTTTITNNGPRPTETEVATVTASGSSSPSSSSSSTSGAAGATATSDGDSAGGGSGGGTGGNKLSGGAIAGIVIGVLAGLALLGLLCFCCIVRGLWNMCFGRKKKHEKERVDIYEEGVSHHDSRVPSAYSRRDKHTGWFGGRRPATAGDRREKKKSGGNWWLGLAGAAATLLALLNLRKDKAPKQKRGSSRYTDSYYSYSDATRTNPSSASSGGRTHRTHRTGRSRDSRGTRATYYSRR